MRALVVIGDVFVYDVIQMLLTEEDEFGEAFRLDQADEAFRSAVEVRAGLG